ncbi:iron uptake transporter permease EfeU [Mycobacterium sp.]|uniref:iron uptake transporter permease EfeU n=1 Tax=Mycobacterium sp. TaxID=1785 RepID=UPI0025F4C751|nr:iron uptake transporter permease EfeU [Mycobacterium sp.]MBW0012533.1 FTR1 family protein [Mycobacterium sp.]
MLWSDALPNFLISLREGLEAGLIVSILLAAVRRAGGSVVPVWLGVVGAVSVSASFAAVLGFGTAALSSEAQDIAGGLLTVAAVCLVTAMIFWMRRVARSLSGELRAGVQRAAHLGTGALVMTAFFAVAREGLETTLFLWAAAKASRDNLAPALGAAVGLTVAIGLCVLLYMQALRVNLGVFFSRTGVLLILVAAGVLAYGLGDLQNAGWLPGRSWTAFDLRHSVNPDSWWATLITGVTNLTPRMTVLQVFAWCVYLAVVSTAFLASGRQPATSETPAREHGWFERSAQHLAANRLILTAAVIAVVPVVVAVAVIAALPRRTESATAITVTADGCGRDAPGLSAGTQRISVTNRSGKSGEVNLVNGAGAVVGEIETMGPATTAQLMATLGAGSYQFVCYLAGQPERRSPLFTVSGAAVNAPRAVSPVTTADLAGSNGAYQNYVLTVLPALKADLGLVRTALAGGDYSAAKRAWLAALLDWERVGASYNSFGKAGTAVAGSPDGLPAGVNDPDFTGLRRLEYGLYHGQAASELLPVVDTTARGVDDIAGALGTDDIAGDPVKLTKRPQEILEDALRDHLSGADDQGGGAALAATAADVDVTQVVLTQFEPLIAARDADLLRTSRAQLSAVTQALNEAKGPDGAWRPLDQTPPAARERVNGVVGAALETLSLVPTLLEVPKHAN